VSAIIHEDRNGCAIHGAVKALSAVEGLVPVLHASAGCGLGARFGEISPAGALGNTLGWQEISATNLLEKHVVFGGTSRLREQIKNTVKVQRGDLYVVATGCVPEVVGDDVPAMVKEAKEQQFPVIGITTPGFKGNAWSGFATTLRQTFEQLPTLDATQSQPRTDLVNLLGVAPGLDPFWEGDLAELSQAFAGIGLEAQTFFGVGQGTANLFAARNAALNVVLSPWGLEAAEFLKNRDGIPYVDFGFLPVGSRDVALLLAQVALALQLPQEPVLAQAKAQDKLQRHHLLKAAPAWLSGEFQRRVAIVGSSAASTGLSRFLAGTLGQIVTTVVITDNPPEGSRVALVQKIRDASEGIEIDVSFAESSQDIQRLLSAASPELVLGSGIERAWTLGERIPLVEVSHPVRDELILDQPLAGSRGALGLASRISRAILSSRPQQISGIRPDLERRPAELSGSSCSKSCSSCG
jgi:nitrogenase molybdenum-iron protein beta chain